MILIRNLVKKFSDKDLFSDFNLEINDGEFVTISGVSGSGKTTLLNIIGGIEGFDGGEVIVNGFNLAQKNNLMRYYGNEVSFIFQNFVLIENKTIVENFQLIPKRFRSTLNITEALDVVGLRGKENQKVYSLSGGEQQRVALARAILKKCNIILADEPTGSLDENNSELVISILKKINLTGKTVVVVTHDSRVKEKGSRIIEL